MMGSNPAELNDAEVEKEQIGESNDLILPVLVNSHALQQSFSTSPRIAHLILPKIRNDLRNSIDVEIEKKVLKEAILEKASMQPGHLPANMDWNGAVFKMEDAAFRKKNSYAYVDDYYQSSNISFDNIGGGFKLKIQSKMKGSSCQVPFFLEPINMGLTKKNSNKQIIK